MGNRMCDSVTHAQGESSRWWEFYVVRYLTGTVVGSFIVYSIIEVNAPFRDLLSCVMPRNGTELLVLLAFGFAYCYIASAPILVLHAGRFLIRPQQTMRPFRRVLFAFIMTFIFAYLFIYIITRHLRVCLGPEEHSALLALVTYLTIVLLQMIIVRRSVKDNRHVYEFYKTLADKREKNKSKEIIDSYRHLREHGDSCFIVIFEVLLGWFLFETSKNVALYEPSIDIHQYLVAIWLIAVATLWTLPAACIWFVSTLIERNFSEPPQHTWSPFS